MMWKVALMYLCVINVLALLVYALDKYRAKKNLSRVSEFNLLALANVGGSVGAWAAMYIFRHKTKHLKFALGLPIVFVAQVALFVYLLK